MLDFTTAKREQLKAVYDAIAAELGDDRFFTTKELDLLPRILAPMEQVLSFSSGMMDGNTWLIVLTDARVLFVDKGMIVGVKQTSINLENIVSIDGKTGFVFGSLRVSTAAGPNEIDYVWKRTVNPFITKVNAAIAARARGEKLVAPGTDAAMNADAPSPSPAPGRDSPPPAPPTAPSGGGDIVGQIERLERLRRAGSIDDAEFEAAKAKIIN